MKKTTLISIVAATSIGLACTLIVTFNRPKILTPDPYSFTPSAERFINSFFQDNLKSTLNNNQYMEFAQNYDIDKNNTINLPEAIRGCYLESQKIGSTIAASQGR